MTRSPSPIDEAPDDEAPDDGVSERLAPGKRDDTPLVGRRHLLLMGAIGTTVAVAGCSSDEAAGTGLEFASPEWVDELVLYMFTRPRDDGRPGGYTTAGYAIALEAVTNRAATAGQLRTARTNPQQNDDARAARDLGIEMLLDRIDESLDPDAAPIDRDDFFDIPAIGDVKNRLGDFFAERRGP